MGDKFKVITEFIKTRDYKLLKERLHDDFLMIREEQFLSSKRNLQKHVKY